MSVQPLTRTGHRPEFEQSILNTLLATNERDGYVSNRDVRDAALVLGCSERRIRNMIARGYVRKDTEPWKPSEDLLAEFILQKGCVGNIYNRMRKAGLLPLSPRTGEPISLRTMQRGFAEHFDQRLRKAGRGGFAALDASLPTVRRTRAGALNDEWAMDHTLLPNWAVMPDGSVAKPWLSLVLETMKSRFVLAVTLSPYAISAEEDVDTIATAVAGFTDDEGFFYGGKPKVLLSDRGGDFLTQAMTVGLIEHGIERNFTASRNPKHNGAVERLNGILKNEICPDLPQYDRSHWEHRDPRSPLVPPPAEETLTVEALYAELLRKVREYNFERPHGALGGLTPAEAWRQHCRDEDGADLVVRVDPYALRASMAQETERMLRRGAVEWNGRFYQVFPASVDEPDTDQEVLEARRALIARHEGRPVRVRHLTSRFEYISVFSASGEYLGDGIWTELMTPEQVGQAVGERRRGINTMSTALEDLKKADAAAVADFHERARNGEVPNDGIDTDYGPATKTAAPNPRSKSTKTASKKDAAQRQSRKDREQVAVNVSRRARTGTDDLDF